LLDRYVRRGCDRIDHHAFERTLPQLARQQPDQKVLLILGGAREQILQCLRAQRRRSGAANRSDVRQAPIDVCDRERGIGSCTAGFDSLAQDGVPDAEAPLRSLAG
jgi:hypothetical protein